MVTGTPFLAALAHAQPVVTRLIGKRRQPDKLIVQLSTGYVTVLHDAPPELTLGREITRPMSHGEGA